MVLMLSMMEEQILVEVGVQVEVGVGWMNF